jgi:hypothetical protein
MPPWLQLTEFDRRVWLLNLAGQSNIALGKLALLLPTYYPLRETLSGKLPNLPVAQTS